MTELLKSFSLPVQQAMLDALCQWRVAERDRDHDEFLNARKSRDDAIADAAAEASNG